MMILTSSDAVLDTPALGRRSPRVVPALVGGTGLFVAGLLLEVFEPGTVVFLSWVFGLPLLVGAVLGARGWRPVGAAAPFVVGYMLDLVHDWIATGGDQLFHLVLALLTGGLAAVTATAARGLRRHFVGRSAEGVPAKS